MQALLAIGFTKKLMRVEYRTPISELPNDSGSPLVWEAMAPSGSWSPEQMATFLTESSLVDPDSDPDENSLEAIRGYLSDPVLTTDSKCIQVGLLDGKPAAIVIAQINPQTGFGHELHIWGSCLSFVAEGLDAGSIATALK